VVLKQYHRTKRTIKSLIHYLCSKTEVLANDYFIFKQFTIQQESTAMKVGTDGVLLGAWTSGEDARRILDIGTGTGLIAIMMAQRFSGEVTALEMDHQAYIQASENIRNCKWSHRIHPVHQSFQNFHPTRSRLFDLILSNPPYFQQALQPPDKQRSTARHNFTLPPEELLEGSIRLLTPKGILSLILPVDEAEGFISIAEKKDLFCNRRTLVYPNLRKRPKRMLLEFSFHQTPLQEDTLTIETNRRHHFTKEYQELTRDFYLYF